MGLKRVAVLNGDWVYLTKAYTTVYALCYIVSPILGLRLAHTDPSISAAGLVLVGIGLLSCLYTKNTVMILCFCAFEAVGCVAHYLKVVPWVPAFSDNAYIVMSLLDLSQAVFLLILVEDLRTR